MWDGWLGSEIRAAYFAALSQRFQSVQRWLTVGSLVLSSGAALTLVSSVLPPNLNWVKPTLAVLAAIVSAVSLAMRYERNAIECKDLHSRWSALAVGYEELWSNVEVPDAERLLRDLREREVAVSTSSVMPENLHLMAEVQDNVLMHHKRDLVAG